MLHTSPHSNDKSKYDAHSMTRNRFSFVGLQVETDLTPSTDDGRVILPWDDAEELGNKLQTLLDGGSQSSLTASVTMDIRTHLAMLQANSLPRSRGVLGTNSDVWLCQIVSKIVLLTTRILYSLSTIMITVIHLGVVIHCYVRGMHIRFQHLLLNISKNSTSKKWLERSVLRIRLWWGQGWTQYQACVLQTASNADAAYFTSLTEPVELLISRHLILGILLT